MISSTSMPEINNFQINSLQPLYFISIKYMEIKVKVKGNINI